MSSDKILDSQVAGDDIVELGGATPNIVLHRLSAVRKAKGIPRRELAARLGISLEELRRKEGLPTSRSVRSISGPRHLGVPITELVVESDESLTPTRLPRLQALALMKAAAKLRDRSRRRGIQRLAQTFVEQLAESFPPWSSLHEEICRKPRSNVQPSAVNPDPALEHVFTRRREET